LGYFFIYSSGHPIFFLNEITSMYIQGSKGSNSISTTSFLCLFFHLVSFRNKSPPIFSYIHTMHIFFLKSFICIIAFLPTYIFTYCMSKECIRTMPIIGRFCMSELSVCKQQSSLPNSKPFTLSASKQTKRDFNNRRKTKLPGRSNQAAEQTPIFPRTE
jgi:hypothetical protein